jgi:hypothetical protein
MKEGEGSWKDIKCTEVNRIKSNGKNLLTLTVKQYGTSFM